MREDSPAAERNRGPIAEALAPLLPPGGTVLEVASGTGQHAALLARRFPALCWQPSEADPAALAPLAARVRDAALPNLRPPLRLDVLSDALPAAAATLCINLLHIAPWAATQALVAKAPGALLLLYGPFLRAGLPTAPSNLAFDAELRGRDPGWGLRRLEDVAAEAAHHGWRPPAVTEMPANNLLLSFRR
ncbi:DUF938 domain-containing protein [Roseococcus sp. DSY-14]|uniref:DUF938 domain-containing protein n=1 Tax=Roseococcus sp. DSY-14 TaxID=3369650 RepID=UPI00387B8939